MRTRAELSVILLCLSLLASLAGAAYTHDPAACPASGGRMPSAAERQRIAPVELSRWRCARGWAWAHWPT